MEGMFSVPLWTPSVQMFTLLWQLAHRGLRTSCFTTVQLGAMKLCGKQKIILTNLWTFSFYNTYLKVLWLIPCLDSYKLIYTHQKLCPTVLESASLSQIRTSTFLDADYHMKIAHFFQDSVSSTHETSMVEMLISLLSLMNSFK